MAGLVINSPVQASEQVGQAQLPIVGGKAATEAEIQATVALLSTQDQEPFCTGTLIAPRVVVTAAHCISEINDDKATPEPPEKIAVGVGSLEAKKTPKNKIYSVSKVVPHPSFPNMEESKDPTGLLHQHDIGLLVLSKPVEGMKPVPVLPFKQFDSVLKEGTPITITGYGVTDDESAGVLFTAQTPYQRRSDSEFLAGRKGEPDSCNGDSGGPAYVSHDGKLFLIGATSRASANSTAACGEGGIYSLVSAFDDWIKASADDLYPPAAPSNENKANAAEDPDDGCSATGRKDPGNWLGAWLLALGLVVARRDRSRH